MSLYFPGNANAFFRNFVLVTNFDILPSSELNAMFFSFDEQQDYNERFTALCYDSVHTIENMGSFLYYIMIIAGLLLIALVSFLLSAIAPR